MKRRYLGYVLILPLIFLVVRCGKSTSGSTASAPERTQGLYEGFYMGDGDLDPVVVISKTAATPIAFLDWNGTQAFEGKLNVTSRAARYTSPTFDCNYTISGSGSSSSLKLTKKGYIYNSSWDRIDRVHSLKRVDFVVFTLRLATTYLVENDKKTRQAKFNLDTIDKFTFGATGISIKEIQKKDLPDSPTKAPAAGATPTKADPLSSPIAPKPEGVKEKLAALFQRWLDSGLVKLDFTIFEAHIADQAKVSYEGGDINAYIADIKKFAYEDFQLKKKVQDGVVDYLTERVMKIANATDRYVRLEELKGGKPVVEYYKKEYSLDLAKMVVGIGDVNAMTSSAGSAGGITAGLFFPPQLGTDQFPTGFTIETRKMPNYKGRYGSVEFKSVVTVKHLNDWLYQEAMKLAFGTEYLVFVEKKFADKNLSTIPMTLAHELRHYLDFKDHPEYFALKERLEERTRLESNSAKEVGKAYTDMIDSFDFKEYLDILIAHFKTTSGEIDEAKSRASAIDGYRDRHYENYRTYYPYLLSKLETNGFAEEAKYMKKSGATKEEAVYELTIGEALVLQDKKLPEVEFKGVKRKVVSPTPVYMIKHFSELYNR